MIQRLVYSRDDLLSLKQNIAAINKPSPESVQRIKELNLINRTVNEFKRTRRGKRAGKSRQLREKLKRDKVNLCKTALLGFLNCQSACNKTDEITNFIIEKN